jgi:hypothetical protein
MDVPLSELDALARRFAGPRHDAYSERALHRAYEEFVRRPRPALAPFVLSVDDHEYPSFYAILEDPNAKFAAGELRLEPAPSAGPAWDFLRPFERIVVKSDGSADLYPPARGAPERAIARVLLREHYLPRSRDEEDRAASGGTRIVLGAWSGTLEQGVAACRQQSLIPLSVALLLYLPDERVRYELDLVRSNLLSDPRAGRLAVGRRVRRSSRVAWGVDRAVGRGDLPLLSARCLEVLVESSGLTAVELAHIFGGVRELLDSALQGLVARQWLTFDRRLGIYRPRIEAFLPPPGPSPLAAPKAAPVADPALRTSVQELIAAADARATCPLCGNPLPPGPRGILCESCASKVDAT